MTHQQQMTGDDWQRQPTAKEIERARAKRKELAPKLVKKLESASDALREFRRACLDCNDGTGGETCGRDSRLKLAADIEEYARYLDGIITRKVFERG